MQGTDQVLFLLFFWHLVGAQEIGILSELPLTELLAQKKIAESRSFTENAPVALALTSEVSENEVGSEGFEKFPRRKTLYEDYEDDKSHSHKKKNDHKITDILNTSITALSYLAFGGYLLCMVASALREKRRRIAMAYPPASPAISNQIAHVLQHYMSHRPARPFIRFPAVTVHEGGKKRRKRFARKKPAREESEEPEKRPPFEFEIRSLLVSLSQIKAQS